VAAAGSGKRVGATSWSTSANWCSERDVIWVYVSRWVEDRGRWRSCGARRLVGRPEWPDELKGAPTWLASFDQPELARAGGVSLSHGRPDELQDAQPVRPWPPGPDEGLPNGAQLLVAQLDQETDIVLVAQAFAAVQQKEGMPAD
jgi:hypothetical protein